MKLAGAVTLALLVSACDPHEQRTCVRSEPVQVTTFYFVGDIIMPVTTVHMRCLEYAPPRVAEVVD